MLILFRHRAKKYAYDTVCGSLTALSALDYRILEATQPPMAQACPTALRYELAKYDSADVEEHYEALYKKAADGVIFAPENGLLRTPDADDETARAALLAAAERLTAPVTPVGASADLAKEILAPKGLLA
ncbi:MAG: hypothetical protein E7585_04260 [Ruminococcaceae bacterium]|nr:hypothetical protein [Oscillospiraceae bacterium]